MPGFGVLLFLLEAGGAWLLWRWIAKNTGGVAPERALPSLSLFAIFALLLFLFGRFSVTIARLENQRLLRPARAFCWRARISASSPRSASPASGRNFPKLDFYVARGLVRAARSDGGGNAVHPAAGNLPPARQRQGRPAALRQPASSACSRSRKACSPRRPRRWIISSASRFRRRGFSSCSRRICRCCCWPNWRCCCCPPAWCSLMPANRRCWSGSAGRSACWTRARISNCPGRWTRFTAIARSKSRRSTSATRRTRKPSSRTRSCGVCRTPRRRIFWSATARRSRSRMPTADTNGTLKAPPVSLITVSIPVQFQITNVLAWAYTNADPASLLQDLATREVVRYLAGVDLNDVMSQQPPGGGPVAARCDSSRRERTPTRRENHFCRLAGHSSADARRRRLRKGRRRRADEAGHDPRRARPRPSAPTRWPARRRSPPRTSPTRIAVQLVIAKFAAGGAVHQPDPGVRGRAVGLPAARLFPDLRRAPRPMRANTFCSSPTRRTS